MGHCGAEVQFHALLASIETDLRSHMRSTEESVTDGRAWVVGANPGRYPRYVKRSS